MRFGTGPVFAYERLTASRRWQSYGLRSFGVSALLVAMGAIASSQDAIFEGRSVRSLAEYASLGAAYFYAIVGVELAVVMLAAPAATAGAICVDRSRGTLEHMLVTDLSDGEVVLGKLAARLMPVLGLIGCTFPVLALSTLLGGIDLFSLVVAFAVIVTVGVLGCSMALSLSVWARKPYEVVLAMYAFWVLLVLAFPLWEGMARSKVVTYGPPDWVLLANPFHVALRPYNASGAMGPRDYLGFFATTLGCSVIFVLLTIRSVRPVAIRSRRPEKVTVRLDLASWLIRWLPGPSLDGNPVLWREWRRARSPRMSLLLTVLVGMTIVACGIKSVDLWFAGIDYGGDPFSGYRGIYHYIFPVVFGLLVLSAVAPMSLSEERQRGSLDVLMTTPLSTRTIVIGKWLSSFRMVPWLATGPGLLGMALAGSPELLRHRSPGGPFSSWEERLFACGLILATILAHGALITSLGLALATRVRHQSRAIGINVTLFVLIALAWPLVIRTVSHGVLHRYPGACATLSPVFTMAAVVDALSSGGSAFQPLLRAAAVWVVVVSVVAFVILQWTIWAFERHMGRMPEQSRHRAADSGRRTRVGGTCGVGE